MGRITAFGGPERRRHWSLEERRRLLEEATERVNGNYQPPCQGDLVLIHTTHESRGTRTAYEARVD